MRWLVVSGALAAGAGLVSAMATAAWIEHLPQAVERLEDRLWGVAGLLMAVPILTCTKVLAHRLRWDHWAAVLAREREAG